MFGMLLPSLDEPFRGHGFGVTRRAMRSHRRVALRGLGIALVLVPLSACVTSAQHNELEAEVSRLGQRVAERDKELKDTLEQADEQLASLQENAKQAETVLRSSQAGLGVRVEELELRVAELRGTADDARMEADSSKRSLEELRADLDTRINALESKLNAATDIPENRSDILKEAKAAFDGKEYARARRLYRTFLSRYPDDRSGPEVRYQIGLTLYHEQDYRAAAGEFNWIRKNAPRAEIIHDAVYYMGMSFAKQGACGNAIKYFEYLASRRSGAPKQYRDQAKKQIDLLSSSAAALCQDSAKGGETPIEND